VALEAERRTVGQLEALQRAVEQRDVRHARVGNLPSFAEAFASACAFGPRDDLLLLLRFSNWNTS
jgi:hypothetical protein